jgi:hypothetical protein
VKKHDLPDIKLGVYEHYKGKRYEVMGVGVDSETEIPVVIYKPLYETNVSFWVRPYDMFMEIVTVDDTDVPRFRYLAGGV